MSNYQKLTLTELIHTWPSFTQQMSDFINSLGLAKLNLVCDHAAIRVNAWQSAASLEQAFCEQGRVLSKNEVNGRPIVIIQLHQGLLLGDQRVTCIELPYPGEKSYPVEGWEHLELVFPCQASTADELYCQLQKSVPTLVKTLANNPDIKLKLSQPAANNELLANPTVAFKKGNICVKVHPYSLMQIIQSTN